MLSLNPNIITNIEVVKINTNTPIKQANEETNKVYCRKCGIEIELDITNPYDICNGCWEEKITRPVIEAIEEVEKKFNVQIWAEWVNNKDKEPKKVHKNY